MSRFWLAKSSMGRKPTFASADELLAACCEYFEWVEDNPLYETKAFAYQGDVTLTQVPKMRAMTIGGLCMFLDVTTTAWHAWRDSEQFSAVVAIVNDAIREQKFTGAAADLLNANIIARDLGLTDKVETDHRSSDGSMAPTHITRTIVRRGDVPTVQDETGDEEG